MLNVIVRNLISNAVKFTPKGGSVIISAYFNENMKAYVCIKDSGIGMNSDMCKNIFRIDNNNNRPGTEGESSTGLGLILCKDFVEKNNGEIWVESEEGLGSNFCFSIPLFIQ